MALLVPLSVTEVSPAVSCTSGSLKGRQADAVDAHRAAGAQRAGIVVADVDGLRGRVQPRVGAAR